MDLIDQVRAYFLIILLISCGISTSKKEAKNPQDSLGDFSVSDSLTSQQSSKNYMPPIKSDSISDSSIVVTDDEFIIDALERVLSFKHVMRNSKVISMTTLTNKFDKYETDTIVNIIRLGKDEFEYYISPANVILLEAEITSSDIVFRSNLHIGSSLMEVLKAFNVEESVDSLVVSDLERYSEFTFVFKHDTLRRISFISKYLD
jgi:S1-C subfamily serine protease